MTLVCELFVVWFTCWRVTFVWFGGFPWYLRLMVVCCVLDDFGFGVV